MADMHCVRTSGDTDVQPTLWLKLRQFLDLVPVKFTDSGKDARFNQFFKKSVLEEEFSFLKKELSALESPSVFCHNDLLLGNIIYSEKKNSVTFIDYEYASYNYQAYDIANHFNEFAGVETVDYSLYPDETYQFHWLRIYLERFHKNISGGKQTTITNEEIQRLFDTVQKFTLASHFLWGIWALIQTEYSAIDFDFLNYAFIRFKEYFARKSNIFHC
ncbi:UNVERIFIED_CONTAM: hypothetical protein PYX00_006006 [Menopon gallinae]